MKRCETFEPLIEELLADEIGDDRRERLLAHAESCSGCREFVDLHYRLLGPESETELPTAGEFAAARQAVLARIRAGRAPSRDWLAFLRPLWLRPAPLWATAALMAAMLAAGWFAGRGLERSGEPVVLGSGTLPELYELARNHKDLADIEDSPYVYSNVRLGEDHGDRLTLRFDVTRHMELTRSKRDPLVREILVQSLLNPSPVSTRLQAVAQAAEMIDPKVKQALIVATLNDPSQVVRLRALEILGKAGDDEDVQSVLLAVLRDEESVQMRLRAMDYLARSSVSPQRFSDALQGLERSEDRALLARAVRYDLGGAERPEAGASR